MRPLLTGAVLLLLLAATLVINFHTAKAVAQFRTNVPWRDQWWFLGELQSVYQGKNRAQVLWSPYWGHRPVIPRLLFFLDARWFALRNTPLLCVSWSAVLAELALMAGVNRILFGRIVSWRFAAALIVMLNLCISSFQMENLIWALQVQYALVFFFAVLSFVLFALAKGRKALLAATCLSALAGSLTMAHGIAIWPVLAMQAALCRSSRKVWIGFLIAFAAASGIYAIGYQMPDPGMGLGGQLKRPMRALEIGLMVLGGPITNQSVPWGVAAGGVGMLALAAFVCAVYRGRRPVWPSVHAAIAIFAAVTAWLTVAGRLSPELLRQIMASGGEILPSRYQTFAVLFWTSLFALSLWVSITHRIALLSALVACYLVIAYARVHPLAADAWADGMRSLDATGTSFLVGAQDWERQKILWGYHEQLDGWVLFAREHRLANFSEERFLWLGRKLSDRFEEVDANRCEGKVESLEALPDGAWRVNGWAWDRGARRPPLDVVLVGAGGLIRGLARGGIRHHDTGGHTDAVAMARAGWLGYSKGADTVQAYVVLAGSRTVCPISGAR
jgi:hypothetical protein